MTYNTFRPLDANHTPSKNLLGLARVLGLLLSQCVCQSSVVVYFRLQLLVKNHQSVGCGLVSGSDVDLGYLNYLLFFHGQYGKCDTPCHRVPYDRLIHLG